ncbi:hypothetical protein LB505_008633 [Fusarium chuoi]|nr:hypothetical protein LB505_008633 [Fusarium chuoi]
MDPFSNLPSLVQTEIFVYLQSHTSIKQIIQASPSMLWHLISYKDSIIRRILNDIVPISTSANIVRDALRIIDISDKTSAKIYEESDIWKTMELPENFTTKQIQTLWRFFIRMFAFIEDYVSKATSVYPPRAYLGVPDIIGGSGSYFKERRLETNVIDFTSLTCAEQHRFLSAFVRYELLCKIFYPRSMSYEEQLVITRKLGAMCQKSKWKILLSVHEYYKAVYGALFAHGANSWLPDIPQQYKTDQSPPTMTSEYGLLFPDDTCFDARAYETDMDKAGRGLAKVLPCFGLDCLTQILACLRKETWHDSMIRKWLRTLPISHFHAWTSLLSGGFPDSLPDMDFRSYDRPRTDRQGQGGPVITFRPGDWRHDVLKCIQLVTYRQRAWGLFDDDRLYPRHTNHFPTFSELHQMESEFGGVKFFYKQPRPMRRSQQWQDSWALGLQPIRRYDNATDPEIDTIAGHLGPCERFFSAPSEKLPSDLVEGESEFLY